MGLGSYDANAGEASAAGAKPASGTTGSDAVAKTAGAGARHAMLTVQDDGA